MGIRIFLPRCSREGEEQRAAVIERMGRKIDAVIAVIVRQAFQFDVEEGLVGVTNGLRCARRPRGEHQLAISPHRYRRDAVASPFSMISLYDFIVQVVGAHADIFLHIIHFRHDGFDFERTPPKKEDLAFRHIRAYLMSELAKRKLRGVTVAPVFKTAM